ncbi:MAG: GNAT family N-acetyltransferase [Candidatus Poribacteria bacterium]|nr:GNAT family N-acetyltransferase [Candidatus Poribacteria bacterium]
MPPTNVTVRRAEMRDHAALVEYNIRLAAETEDIHLDRPTVEKGVQAGLEDEQKAIYFVAEAGGEVIGQLMLTMEWSDWRNGPMWWFQSVYVREDWREKGVFRALHDKAIDDARQHGVRAMRLYVLNTNDRARAVYERLGLHDAGYVVYEREPV